MPSAASGASLSPASELTLLDYTLATWVAIILLALISPLVGILNRAGTYGKLMPASAAAATARKPSSSSSSSSASTSTFAWLFHPRMYVRTSRAFIGYYAFACIWNGWLLFEADVSAKQSDDSTRTVVCRTPF